MENDKWDKLLEAINEEPIISTRKGLHWVLYDDNIGAHSSLRRAQKQAEEQGGFVASLPQLLRERVLNPYTVHTVEGESESYRGLDMVDKIWIPNLTGLSEEDVGKTRRGSDVLVEVHGGGIVLSSPERMERAYETNPRATSVDISDLEVYDLLDGRLPDGTEIPIFPFNEFRQGIRDLPARYGVVMDLDMAKKSLYGGWEIQSFHNDPLMIVRAGGVEEAIAYMELARNNYDDFDNYHHLKDLDPNKPQGKWLSVDGIEDNLNSAGLLSNHVLGASAHFVAVYNPRGTLENKFQNSLIIAIFK